MATTVLECEQFATILLDTEGIDAIGASETMAMSLLTVTTLLSSYLIYNSKKVPQKVDLDKMRCFTQLSTSLLMQKGESIDAGTRKKFFPHFLWLLRDVTLTMTDRANQTISATEYLHTRVLASEAGQPTELGKSLCSLFPSLECHILPMPTINSKLIKKIVEQQDKLEPAFNKAVDELIQRILQQVTPKKAIDGVSVVDGPALAALTCGYVDAINTPGAIPDLEQGWQAVIKWKLKELSDNLVEEYREEMEAYLRSHPPMDEESLRRKHEETLCSKMESLQQAIHQLKPLSSTSGGEDPVLGELEEAISRRGEGGEVIGGVLFQFTTLNYSKSKQQCEEALEEVVNSSGFHQKCQEAFLNSKALDLRKQIQEIEEQYHKHSKAVGAAAEKVLEKRCRELAQLWDMLKFIPGPPSDVEIVGEGPDRVKLSWLPPKQNPEVAESYIVWKQEEAKQWEVVTKTSKTKLLITGLKSHTRYQFRVIAVNEHMESVEAVEESTTMLSKLGVAANCAMESMQVMMLPVVIDYHFKTTLSSTAVYKAAQKHKKVIAAATLPIGILSFPLTLPLTIVAVARRNKGHTKGDLSPVDDDDDV